MRRVITKNDIAAFAKARPTYYTYQAERVEKGPETPPAELVVTKAPPQLDDYVSQVVKYIPAEIVAAFVTIDGILRSAVGISSLTGWLVFVALLILTPIYTWHVTKEQGLPPPYGQVGVSTAGFAVWVLALGGPFAQLPWYNSVYGSILLIFFTLIPPLVIGNKPSH